MISNIFDNVSSEDSLGSIFSGSAVGDFANTTGFTIIIIDILQSSYNLTILQTSYNLTSYILQSSPFSSISYLVFLPPKSKLFAKGWATEESPVPLVAMYSYNVQTQAVAYRWTSSSMSQSPPSLPLLITMMFSLDGESFTKFSGNPVIPKPEEWKDFRDPKVCLITFGRHHICGI